MCIAHQPRTCISVSAPHRQCTIATIKLASTLRNPKTLACVQQLRKQMKKDVRILLDATRAAASLAAPPRGLVAFEGAFARHEEQEVAIVLEYMNGGSLEDLLRKVWQLAGDTATLCLVQWQGPVHDGHDCPPPVRASVLQSSADWD